MTTKSSKTPKLNKRGDSREFSPQIWPPKRIFKSIKNAVLDLSPKTVTRQPIRRIKRSLWRVNQLSTPGQKALKTMRTGFCFAKKSQKLRFEFYRFVSRQDLSQIVRVLEKINLSQDIRFEASTMQELTDESLWLFCEGLKRCVFLKRFSLNFVSCEGNAITDRGIQFLSKCIKKLISLQDLSLYLTMAGKITNIGIYEMGKTLKRLIYLQNIRLDFSYNPKITTKELSFFVNVLRNLSF